MQTQAGSSNKQDVFPISTGCFFSFFFVHVFHSSYSVHFLFLNPDGNNTYTLTFVHGSNPYEVAQVKERKEEKREKKKAKTKQNLNQIKNQQDFITQNGLSSNFVTQIVEHIIKNTTDPAVLRNLVCHYFS